MIEDLFGEVGMIAWEDFMEDVPSDVGLSEQPEELEALKKRLEDMHILDGLDWINDDDNWNEFDEEMRGEFLRECVQ